MKNYLVADSFDRTSLKKEIGIVVIISTGLFLLAWQFDLYGRLSAWLDQSPDSRTKNVGVLIELLIIALIAFGVFSFRQYRILNKEIKNSLLQETQMRLLAQTVVSAQDSIVITDLTGKILLVNDAFQRTYGYSEAELLGDNISIVHSDRTPDDVFRDLSNKTVEGGWHGEVYNKRKDGSVFPFELWTSVLRGDNGTAIATIGVGRDITERKRVEESLSESEERYRKLVAASPDAIVVTNEKGEITFVSERAMELFEEPSMQNVIGHNVLEWVDQSEYTKAAQNIAFLFANGYPKDKEYILLKKDGTHFHGELNSAIVNMNHGGTRGMILVIRDVTKRTQSEKLLLESKKRLNLALEGAQMGVWEWDLVTDNIFWSPECFEITGVSTDVFNGKLTSFTDIILPDDRVNVISSAEKAIKDKTQFMSEFRIMRPDGELRWLSDFGLTEYDATGKPLRLVGTVQDITERKRTEEELYKSEEQYRLLAESSLTGVYLFQDEIFRYVNPAFANVFGYNVDEIIDKLGPFDLTVEDHHTMVSYQIKKRLTNNVNHTHYFFRGKRKDGTQIDVEVHGTVTTYKGKPAILGTLLDITEQRKAQEQLLSLSHAVEQSPVSIVMTDPTGTIHYVNKKFTEISGYSADDVLGKKPNVLKSGFTSDDEYAKLWKTISAGNEWHGQFHNKKKNGELYWEQATISPIKNNDNEITHYVAIKEDITEKKHLEEQILRAQRLDSIGTLAGGIAHDLNNVLAPILMAVEILKRQFPQESSHKILDTLEASANRGKNIIKQVLTFARGSNGEHSSIQPKYLVKEIDQLIQETFPKSIQIRCEYPKNLWTITGDVTQLHQVLMNLCVNARDAMPSGGILLLSVKNEVIDDYYVDMRKCVKPGKYILISVADTGTGIPDSIKDKIFDPFFTTKEIGKGTGLGLSTVHTIVKSHNGFIELESEAGKGTTFKIYLPASGTVASQSSEENKHNIPLGNNETILIIDDEPSVREVMRQTLEIHNYRAIAVEGGVEALSVFSSIKGTINAVITDMMMPILDGPSTIRSLRIINPNIKVIATSGLSLKEQQLLSKHEVEVDAFLLKPYTAESLLKTLQHVLANSSIKELNTRTI